MLIQLVKTVRQALLQYSENTFNMVFFLLAVCIVCIILGTDEKKHTEESATLKDFMAIPLYSFLVLVCPLFMGIVTEYIIQEEEYTTWFAGVPSIIFFSYVISLVVTKVHEKKKKVLIILATVILVYLNAGFGFLF